MSSHYIVPTFNKATPNKVSKHLEVTGQNTISHPSSSTDWFSAIATESIRATVDGEYIFAVRVHNIDHAAIMIGVTSTETVDSDWNSYPGFNGMMTGCALHLYDGNYFPAPNLIDCTITKKAKEVIVVVTISSNFLFGRKYIIRWIVDGTSSVNRDCSADCKGNTWFPVVSLYGQNTQVTTIPIDQITIRNDEINKLIEKFSKLNSSSNQGAVAVGNNDEPQLSFAAFAQLQQELEKERKRADSAESQLREQSSEITQLKLQLLTLQSQLNNRY